MSLHFKKLGSGEPVVLIHGLFGSLENLGVLARELSNHYSVYAIDLPNHGKSPHHESISLAEMAESVKTWFSDLEHASARFLGHSLGGKVAMELALSAPNLVSHLAVIDIAPVKYEPSHESVFRGLMSFDPAVINSRTEADAYLQKFVPEPAVRSFLLKNLVRGDKGFYWRMNLSGLHANYEKLIEANRLDNTFDGSTLFLKGEHSDYLLEAYRDEIIRRFSNASSKVIHNTGHWLHAEKPELVTRIVENFFRD